MQKQYTESREAYNKKVPKYSKLTSELNIGEAEQAILKAIDQNKDQVVDSYEPADEVIEPTMYDVLTCLTKYDPETFENFCSEYGYDEDSRTAERTYKAVCKEYEAVDRLFSDVMEELQEIQ